VPPAPGDFSDAADFGDFIERGDYDADRTGGVIFPSGEDFFIVQMGGERFIFDIDAWDDVQGILDEADVDYEVYEQTA
jgi:hypothetical protein